MLIRLISLAILLLLIDMNRYVLSDDKFILPKDKPSVFKKIDKSISSNKNLIPKSKPVISSKEVVKEP